MFKVSIIIPVYNVSQYIERCLLSVIKQTYKDIEIVLVDDASPDDSMLKVQKILTLHPEQRVSVVTHDNNKGLSAARNSGVKNSTGDYLFFLDSDDAIPENAIKLLTDKVIQHDVDLIVGGIEIIGASSNKFPSLKLSEEKIWYNPEVLHSFFRKEWYEMACNKLIKRELFFQQNCWFQEGIVHEDNLWSFQVAQCCCSMAVCKTPTYYYYIQSQSITQKKTERNFDSLCFIIRKMIESSSSIREKDSKFLLCHYLWELKIFCLKSLVKSNLSKAYLYKIYRELNVLYTNKLFGEFRKPMSLFFKDKFLDCVCKVKI